MGDQGQIRKLSQMLTRIKPYLAIVALQFGYAGMFIVVMVSLKRGMNNYVLVVYRHAVATIVITPFALVLERKTRPKMTLSIFLKIVVLGFLELEKVNFKQMHSLAKVIGTTITVSGAMVMTLYKGPIVDIIWYSHSTNHHETTTNSTSDQHWVTGTIMLLASTGGWSGFFILQSITLKQYPAELSLAALICLMGMVEGAVAALVMERDMGAWVIGFDSRLLAAVYSGVVCSGIAYYVQGVVNKARGPVFVTAFSPLCMIITAALGAIVLAEQVHLGSLIGAIIVVFGLYSVVWGKSKDPLNSEALTFETGKAYELPVVDTNKSTIVDDDDAHKSKFSGKNALPQQP
ncbi:nodulin MtN21 /EamA-like transporter family protein [Actinidia rufa]|uniref:WAT1-related protein n=1 Tax=Actinidia rufa TaxID=165716 RepID=A0A7J0DJF1_9ERIC|nr:nodulin MtN21 /EamA-like transporter family protein [Actinidia rufa]